MKKKARQNGGSGQRNCSKNKKKMSIECSALVIIMRRGRGPTPASGPGRAVASRCTTRRRRGDCAGAWCSPGGERSRRSRGRRCWVSGPASGGLGTRNSPRRRGQSWWSRRGPAAYSTSARQTYCAGPYGRRRRWPDSTRNCSCLEKILKITIQSINQSINQNLVDQKTWTHFQKNNHKKSFQSPIGLKMFPWKLLILGNDWLIDLIATKMTEQTLLFSQMRKREFTWHFLTEHQTSCLGGFTLLKKLKKIL